MNIYEHMFPLGFGTNRFSVKNPADSTEFEYAIEVVRAALDAGVSYFDVSHTYSNSMAQSICKAAFRQTKAPRHVTVKSSLLYDTTADDALRRTEDTLRILGVDHAFSFVLWNISSYEQFLKIMQKGGLYEGAVAAQKRGLVEHICFSSHAPPADIIKILNTDVFEGVTLSFSVLNKQVMEPILDCAKKRDIGVVVMNPLGGGLIPQQQAYFSFLQHSEESSVQAALRYVYAHPAVKIVLSGMSSLEELRENLGAFRNKDPEKAEDRIARVDSSVRSINGFCTGCRYCDGCPKGINVYELMQAYNTTLFPQPNVLDKSSNSRLREDISICDYLNKTFGRFPADCINPCIKCGRCAERCTARLPIIQRIEEIYKRCEEIGFSECSVLYRLRRLIGEKSRIAFYPAGRHTERIMSLLNQAFSGKQFEISLFDSNSGVWGRTVAGVGVQNPEGILQAAPEIIIISSYNFSEEIYESLSAKLGGKIPVVKLHYLGDDSQAF